MPKKYEFTKLKEPKPGDGFSKHCSWNIRVHGQEWFKSVIQSHPEDLPDDLWGPGNVDMKDTWWLLSF